MTAFSKVSNRHASLREHSCTGCALVRARPVKGCVEPGRGPCPCLPIHPPQFEERKIPISYRRDNALSVRPAEVVPPQDEMEKAFVGQDSGPTHQRRTER
jgi:hypothetical protein